MVHRMDHLDDSPEKSCRKKLTVKTEELNDSLVSLSSKRPKLDSPLQENVHNPVLEEPSPLGLKLKKSPSFLDLIQMKLTQEKSVSLGKTLARKEKGSSGGGVDKIKASNFPACLLKIGSWEYKSRYEGDLVAKCYFAKHKLVWEVLDGGLKNKIEIQWSDIMAIKANCPDNAPGTLDVVLARQPLFFREINPQPRKHTLWQATSDFSSGQATIHRQHFLQFPQGTLGKHFEKLMQCDPRLRFLSQQPEIVLDSPYFQPMVSIFGDSDHDHGFELKTEMRTGFSGFRDTLSSSGLSSSDLENQDPVGTPTEYNSRRNPSPIPEMFTVEGDGANDDPRSGLGLLNQIKLPGLHPSMSVGDLVTHIGECISEQMRSGNPNISIDESEKRNILEEISHYLLTDSSQTTTPVSDEKYIMSRVNSLCCLLQKENSVAQNMQVKSQNIPEGSVPFDVMCQNQTAERSQTSEKPSISRKDSVGELLLHLPRIASLPQFLVSDSSDQGRL